MSIYFYGNSNECTEIKVASVIMPRSMQIFRVSADQDLSFTVNMRIRNVTSELSGVPGLLILGAIAITNPDSLRTKEECSPTIDFHPELSRNYVFQLNSDGESCNYQFEASRSIHQRIDEAVHFTYKKRERNRLFFNEGRYCK